MSAVTANPADDGTPGRRELEETAALFGVDPADFTGLDDEELADFVHAEWAALVAAPPLEPLASWAHRVHTPAAWSLDEPT